DHVVFHGRVLRAWRTAFTNAPLVLEDPRVGLAETAVLLAPLARHRLAQLRECRWERCDVKQLAGAVEAHRLPVRVELDGLQEPPALLVTRHATSAETYG